MRYTKIALKMNGHHHRVVGNILSRCGGICFSNKKPTLCSDRMFCFCVLTAANQDNSGPSSTRSGQTRTVFHWPWPQYYNYSRQTQTQTYPSLSSRLQHFANQYLHGIITCRFYSSLTFPTQLNIDGREKFKEIDVEYVHGDEEYGYGQEAFEQSCPAKKQESIDSKMSKNVILEKKVKASSDNSKVKYPLKGMGRAKPVYTENFDDMKHFLESLNIPTDELQFYPDIQGMTRDDIMTSVTRLRECRIHVIFSLFLLQRIFMEITLEKTAAREPIPQPKQWFKLRNGMYKLKSMRYVVVYLELCKLLENPHLDPISFVDRLADVGIFDHLQTVATKTRKLRSVGAKPKDIMDNLKLYNGAGLFNSKIKMYQNVIGNASVPFPVKLFLCTTLAEFKEKLHVGDEVKAISKILNVKEADFLMCWGFKAIRTKSLIYKVHMCLKAGISQTDVFNNIGILDRITVSQCHRVTQSLCKSGQPGSVFVFRALESNLQHRARSNNSDESDWTGESGDDSGSDQPTLKTAGTKGDNSKKEPIPINKSIQSSKMWRMEVFKLVTHLLNLDRSTRCAMYKADINIDPTQLVDVTRNLEFLVSQKFTKEDIAHCPIVLAHPFDKLVRVKRDLEGLLKESSVTMPSSSLSSSSSSLSSSPISSDGVGHTGRSGSDGSNTNVNSEDVISLNLLSDPVFHLNVLQYYLEKETNFSLNYTQTQSVVEFFN